MKAELLDKYLSRAAVAGMSLRDERKSVVKSGFFPSRITLASLGFPRHFIFQLLAVAMPMEGNEIYDE
jgi:hypothetical protein